MGRHAIVALVLLAAFSFAAAAEAQTEKEGVEAGKGRRIPVALAKELEKTPEQKAEIAELRLKRKARLGTLPVKSRISRYTEAAAEATDDGKPEEAMALLERLNLDRLNHHERALVLRLKAHVAYGAGDPQGAIEDFEAALAEEVLTVDADNKMRFSIAQLYAAQQKWPEVITALDRWFRYVEEPAPLAFYLRALAYYQLEKIDLAIVDAETAIDLSPDPPEGWLQLLAALYVQKQDYQSVAPLFEELVLRFPKKSYWVQLSLIYAARDNYRESLAVQQVAYLQGYLTEDKEIRRLARSYLYHELPFQAAEVLEKGLDDGVIEPDADFFELLANSWIAAREYERSLPPLLKAAELSEDGNLFVRLGQVYLQREDWRTAAEYLQQGLAKGGLKDMGNARLLQGIAYYNSGSIDRARSSFVQASQHEKTRERARTWISHIARETQAS